jgi:hypothetical protein
MQWEYHGSHILSDFTEDCWKVAESTCRNGFKWITDSLHWIQRCNCLMQGGKQYENLSEGLKLSYTAWTTSPAIGSFHFVADLPALFIIILITALVYRGMKESRNAKRDGCRKTVYYPSGDRGRRILCRYG